ncbi:MAG TPA: oxidoreductase [Clostridia bacterium]
MSVNNINVKKEVRKGGVNKTEIWFADLIINEVSLYKLLKDRGFDLISCLGWSFIDIQQNEIDKFLLKGLPDFKNYRYAIYVCPECGDLGCGAISIKIERQGEIVIWSDFGFEDNLEIEAVKYDKLKDIGPFYFRYDNYEGIIKSTLNMGDTFSR